MARKPQDLTQYHGHHVVSSAELRTQLEAEADEAAARSRRWRKIRHGVAIIFLVALLMGGGVGAWARRVGDLDHRRADRRGGPVGRELIRSASRADVDARR